MRTLSATEAISPAIEHTKQMLLPFRLGLWLKLGLVGLIAELGGAGFNFGGPHTRTPLTPNVTNPLAHAFSAGMILFLAILAVAGLVLLLLLLYFASRLQLVLMDLVATRTTLVSPAWQRTAPRTWRWIGLRVVTLFALSAVIAILIGIPAFVFVRRTIANGDNVPFTMNVGPILLFVVAVLIGVFIALAVIWILRDLVLPFVLFENASFSASLGRAFALINREPGAVALYLLMKLLLSIALGIAIALGLLLGLLVAAIPLGLVGALAWFLLHAAGTAASILMYLLFALLALVFLAVVVCLYLGAICGSTVFYQAYALYFVGGRIPAVGDLLEPPPYYPQVPVPPFAPV